MKRTAIFIDGSNLHATTKALHWNMDYKRLRDWLNASYTTTGLNYYTAVRQVENNPVVNLVNWLSYNGFRVKSKETKEWVDIKGHTHVKGNMDIEMAVDALLLAETNSVDHMLFFTGDGDFRRVVEAIQDKGVTVSVASTLKPPMIADELRRQADDFVELFDHKEKFGAPFVKRDFVPETKRVRFGT